MQDVGVALMIELLDHIITTYVPSIMFKPHSYSHASLASYVGRASERRV